ncbi:MAG: hypothetical protein J4G16_06425 [Acidobacteria bacterium]|nr:hypothetical protein [Acidobacteriota bacterium]
MRIALAVFVGWLAPVCVAAQGDSPAGLAVTPFVNISGAPAEDWIGAGIAETIAATFEGRSSVRSFRRERVQEALRTLAAPGTAADSNSRMVEVGRTVGARWVVGGAYQRLGDRMRITARLVDVPTGAVTASTVVDGAVDDLFVLQDRVAGDLFTGAGLGAGPEEAAPASQAASRPVDDADLAEGSFQPTRPFRRPQSDAAGARPAAARPTPARRARSDDANRPAGTAVPRPAATAEPSPAGVAGFETARVAPGFIDGPPPPIAPEVIRRDEQRRATLRAVEQPEGIRLDGQLDERVYYTVPAITGFIQQAPDEGAPATEKTEAWILFDADNIYVAARVWDSAPPSQWVANEMRRDTRQLRQNDTFAVILDTFYDRRNAVAFYTNPLGAIADFQITNEGNPNSDWNPVWDVRAGRFEGGWTVEMEIPFKSLRYRPGPSQIWGVQLRRNVRRKNEWNYITPLPISAGSGPGGIFRVSDAATLVGLDAPSGSRNLEVKPYGIGGVSTNLAASPPIRNAGDGNGGLDVKYGVTQNLTADFTVNTDFAQVEVDEQQVNLTRFNLFFPEKREFFLEGRGIFDFARGGFSGGFGGALRRTGGGFFGGGNAPTIFYSRRIGLQNGTVVPIVGGGRLTGKIGAFDVGALNIQTDDEVLADAEMTNFTVVRLKRDILRRSSLGAIFTNRSLSLMGDGSSQSYGADATFSFYENVSLLGYVARTQVPDPGRRGNDLSYQGRFDYGGDRYGFQAEHLLVEKNFIPEVGFLRRDNFRRSYARARFSPRPRALANIRQFRLEGSYDYVETADLGTVETRQSQLGFSTELENSDRFGVSLAENYEFLHGEFTPGPDDVAFPVGGYRFFDVEATWSPGTQRRLNGTFSVLAGDYFDGSIRTVGFRQGRMEVTQRLSLEPSFSVNWIDSPHGSFRTDLIVSRVNWTFTPRMFFSGLIQYNSSSNTVSNNLRLRWEYSPGSELFVVYTEDRETDPLRPDRFSDLRNRGFVVKMNRLFRF